MPPAAPLATDDALWINRRTWLLFCLNGVLFGSWALNIPALQQRWELPAASLALMLSCVTFGNFFGIPVVTAALQRVGLRRTVLTTLGLMGVGLALASHMPTLWLTGLCLLIFGAGFGGTDLSLNQAGAWAENTTGRSLMSSLHGAFSLGTVFGALLGTGMTTLNFFPDQHLVASAAMIPLIGWPLALQLPRQLPSLEQNVQLDWARVPRPVWAIVILGLTAALCEGITSDWCAVYLKEMTRATPLQISLAFGIFSLTMVVGRLIGDHLIDRYGSRPVRGTVSTVSLLGFFLVILHPGPWLTLAGFAIAGAGMALMAPSAFSAAGRSAWPLAMSALSTAFQVGFLLGPVITGLISHQWGYAVVFWLPALCALIYLAVSVSRPKTASPSHY